MKDEEVKGGRDEKMMVRNRKVSDWIKYGCPQQFGFNGWHHYTVVRVAKSIGKTVCKLKKQSPRINVHYIAADILLISLTQMSPVNGESDLTAVLESNTPAS